MASTPTGLNDREFRTDHGAHPVGERQPEHDTAAFGRVPETELSQHGPFLHAGYAVDCGVHNAFHQHHSVHPLRDKEGLVRNERREGIDARVRAEHPVERIAERHPSARSRFDADMRIEAHEHIRHDAC